MADRLPDAGVESSHLTPIAVVLATRGRFAETLRTVRDLLVQEGVALELIVVDQNERWPDAHEPERSALAARPGVTWLERVEPGVVAARNLGVSLASALICVFVDDDVEIADPRFLAKHAAAYDDASVGAVCGRELPPGRSADEARPQRVLPTGRTEALLEFDRAASEAAEVAVFSTCNGSVRRDAFIAVGGFDEQFRGASYGDDADFALRLVDAGWTIRFDPRPWLVHLMVPAGGLRLSDPANRYRERERALSGWLFALRHASGALRWRLVYGWVLRRTLLLRRNAIRPWRWPASVVGIVAAYFDARAAVRTGVRSRFLAAGR